MPFFKSKIKKTESYQISDGRLFSTEREAKLEEAMVGFDEWRREKFPGAYIYYTVTLCKSNLIKHRDDILKFLCAKDALGDE